jgi:hypothetical protein
MARPIKETPILEGKHSEKFLEIVKKNESDKTNRVSRDSYDQSKELYKKVRDKATF